MRQLVAGVVCVCVVVLVAGVVVEASPHHNHHKPPQGDYRLRNHHVTTEDLERQAVALELESLQEARYSHAHNNHHNQQHQHQSSHHSGGHSHHDKSDLERMGSDSHTPSQSHFSHPDGTCAGLQPHLALIPMPREIVIGESCFGVEVSTTQVLYQGNVEGSARQLTSLLRLALAAAPLSGPASHGPRPPPSSASSIAGWGHNNTIVLIVLREDERSQTIGPEGYLLHVARDSVVAVANTEAGVFHAIATLRQLTPPHAETQSWTGPIAFPEMSVVDWPVYSWRGMHLDVSRHFFDTAFVKRFIDLLALHKMNRFHWHLTDDQGWRVPISAYPKLTEVGGWRREGGQQYGGAYSRSDIDDVVRYAADRFITVVPEIEMPGHAQAAIAAYPHLGCPGHAAPQVWTDWGVSHEAFCAGNAESTQFLEHVLEEVMEMFPSVYVHVGGDECDKTHWQHCSLCRHRMQQEGLTSPEQLQASFTSHMSSFLAHHGKRLVGWDEILEGGLDKGATVMSWRGVDGGVEAARRGLDAVMTPMNYAYFDRSYEEGDRLGRFGTLSLRDTYEWNVLPDEMEPEIRKHVLGGQGNVWTEGMAQEGDVEYLSVPRISAVAEVLWSPSQVRSWNGFRSRLKAFESRLQALNVHYYAEPSVQSATFEDIQKLRSDVGSQHGTRPTGPNGSRDVMVMDLETDTDHILARDSHFYARMFQQNGAPL
eukprot:c11981_g1_i1.p1 GENE.c11981_g1_i1~~c11981_g1_i1.p1  ORF type:complete len:709 (+),score=191.92 c11981_g1_i1:36-2162(+)